MIGEKRLFGIIALILGLIAGVLILLNVQSKGSVDLITLIAGIGVLYGSYLIDRGKNEHPLRLGEDPPRGIDQPRDRSVDPTDPGGVGGTPSILAILSGILAFLSA